MKKITLLTIFVACGLLATSVPAYAQTGDTGTGSNWLLGKVSLTWLTRDAVASSKFEEYRVVPTGLSMPEFFITGRNNGNAFSIIGKNVAQADQRYTGFVNTNWLGVSFDFNQIAHRMGNGGRSIETETAPGVWSMSSTLRAALGTAVDTRLPTSTRTYPFYADLFAPTIAAANLVDLDSLRQRGTLDIDLGQKLPFDLTMTYMREVKSGNRGAGGGVVYSAVNSIVELPQSLNELTQDFGFQAALNKSWGNVHAAYAHNWYNNRLETTVFDNPLRPSDLAYVSSSLPGGPGSGRLIGPPDNSADRTSGGVLLKFKMQTRITADVATGQWLQNAQLYPYTINSTILTPSGVAANSLAALDVQSLNGKIKTTTYNVGFSMRPIEGLGLRLRYRSYDVNNQTPTFVRTGSVGNAPDRSWTALTASNYAESPLGWETASPYGYKTGRLDFQASYDIKMLTFEGTYRSTQIDRTYREATKGTEKGGSLAVVLHQSDWLLFRGVYDTDTRLATQLGSPDDTVVTIGLQSDESERKSTRTGVDVELSPGGKMTFTLGYFRRNDDYPNRPNRAAGVDGTSNGLLSAKYDTYTVEADFTPSERADLGVFYTYEKNISTTRYGGTGSAANAPYTPLMSMLTFDGSDKTNTYGVYANFVLVPDKWTFDFNVQDQKLDALMAIAGDPGGSFALARAAYGGIQDITGYDDTHLTSVSAQLRYSVAKAWDLSGGYAYQKYVFADDYTSGTEVFPATGGFYLKANKGDYKTSVIYLKMNYRF